MNDTTPPVDQPIAVNPSAIPEQLGQAMRTLLIALGGFMAGKGWIDANVAAAAVPVVMVAGPFLWGQFRVLKTHGQRVTMADAAPDNVAILKGQEPAPIATDSAALAQQFKDASGG